MEVSGRCLCGACAFNADVATEADGAVKVDVCHCGMCRRWTGAPFMGLEVQGAPRFEDGAPIGLYQSSDWAERAFCKTCGTALFWRLRDDGHLTMPAGLFDDPSSFRLTVEIFVDHKPDFYAFEGDRPQMTEAEVVAMFSGGAGGAGGGAEGA